MEAILQIEYKQTKQTSFVVDEIMWKRLWPKNSIFLLMHDKTFLGLYLEKRHENKKTKHALFICFLG